MWSGCSTAWGWRQRAEKKQIEEDGRGQSLLVGEEVLVHLVGLLTSIVLACATFLLGPSRGYALNRQLEPNQPGLYSSGQDGGCDDPNSKDRMTREFDALMAIRGKPAPIVSDNGTELTSMVVL